MGVAILPLDGAIGDMLRVLKVEDDIPGGRLVERILIRAGCEVVRVMDVANAGAQSGSGAAGARTDLIAAVGVLQSPGKALA